MLNELKVKIEEPSSNYPETNRIIETVHQLIGQNVSKSDYSLKLASVIVSIYVVYVNDSSSSLDDSIS